MSTGFWGGFAGGLNAGASLRDRFDERRERGGGLLDSAPLRGLLGGEERERRDRPPSSGDGDVQASSGASSTSSPQGGDRSLRADPHQVGQIASSYAGELGADAAMQRNLAIVVQSSAKSESSFDHTVTHDGGIGYGMFGHNGDRLRAMRAYAGADRPDPASQTRFATRELWDMAQRNPAIARVLANPNASPEDLTRVQMHFERPAGYRPNAPERGHRWGDRLTNTRFFMGGGGQPPGQAAIAPPSDVIPLRVRPGEVTIAPLFPVQQPGQQPGPAAPASASQVEPPEEGGARVPAPQAPPQQVPQQPRGPVYDSRGMLQPQYGGLSGTARAEAARTGVAPGAYAPGLAGADPVEEQRRRRGY